MFCKWCGKKITNIGKPCPSCGKEQAPLESGNGFWDLCSNGQAGHTGVGGAAVEHTDGPSKTASPRKSNAKERRAARRFWIGAWAITCLLLVIALVMLGLGIGKIGQYRSGIAALRSDISDVNALVADGFAKIGEYHQNEQKIPKTTEPQADIGCDPEIDPDALLEDDRDLLIDPEVLDIEICEIDTTPVKCVYMAVGALPESGNVKIFWQKSIDRGETWITVLEDIAYMVVDQNESEAYRVICLEADASDEYRLYCAEATAFDGNTDVGTDEPETDPEEEQPTEPENTDAAQPTEDPENTEEHDSSDSSAGGTTTPTDPDDDGSVRDHRLPKQDER